MLAVAALAWSLLAFGSVYPWAAPPLLALSLLALLAAGATPSLRDPIDAAALAALAVIAFQLMPLPAAAHDLLSPQGGAYRAAMALDFDARAWAPLSLDPRRTRVMLMIAASAFALYTAARHLAPHEGRRLARWIAWLALAASLIGFGARTLFPDGRIYGFWTPLERGAAPFGAVINRNHFAAWAIMAVVIALGGLAAHAARRREHTPARRALVATLSDTRALWLLFAAAVTVAAIVTTASRSGFAALVAAAAAAILLMRRRAGARAMTVVAVAGAVCLIAAMSWARPDRLLSRLEMSGSELGLRQTIWKESAAISARYPLAGVGAGAFPSAMAFYQTGSREVFFNHAHNQYLETAVEGGLLLGVPIAVMLIALIRRIGRRMRAEHGSALWLRIGAAAALAGLAVACIWESPFRTPATLMLAAVAAGLASADPRD